MRVSVIGSLDGVGARDWDALVQGYPFVRYDFLAALERTGCVEPATGWTPQHLGVFADNGALLAAAPCYVKHHSYGEFVFDWAWAQAYARAGMNYYPKLVVAVPFTPATGPRILLGSDAPAQARSRLIDGVREHAKAIGASSAHWLFPRHQDLSDLVEPPAAAQCGGRFRRPRAKRHDVLPQ